MTRIKFYDVRTGHPGRILTPCPDCRGLGLVFGAVCAYCEGQAFVLYDELEQSDNDGARMNDHAHEVLGEMVALSIRMARREGVPLETFLETQWRRAPPHVSRDARVLLMGLAVVLWFESPTEGNPTRD